ncbi:nitric-oxide synthase [Acrasis kona]|uniref:Nitric-oxide synthase n=1 Tax=Acrasis kona TaxID=1008807 RepID=A0AAW2YYA7_9EUKA
MYLEVKKKLISQYHRDRAANTKHKVDDIKKHIVPDDALVLDRPQLQAFERIKKQKPIVCQRCFELINYNGQNMSVDISAQDFYKSLSKLKEKKRLMVVKIVDLFNVEGSIIPDFEKVVGTENPVLIVGNKLDLLPRKRTNDARIREWLKKQVSDHMPQLTRKRHLDEFDNDEELQGNIKSQIRGVVMVSSKTGEGMIQLANQIEKLRKGYRDVYIVGCTNVGKSTLINRLVQQFPAHDKSKKINFPKKLEEADYDFLIDRVSKDRVARTSLTTSLVPGTTLNSQSLILTSAKNRNTTIKDEETGELITRKPTNSYLFDTPGVIHPHSALNLLAIDDYKKLMPDRRLVPKFYQMRPGRTLFLGGLARIDYISCETKHEHWKIAFFTLFSSTSLDVHITGNERAGEFYKEHFGTRILSPPLLFPDADNASQIKLQQQEADDIRTSHVLWDMPKKKTFEFNGVTRGKSIADIVIPGVGWISVTGVGHLIVDVYVPEKLEIYVRDSILPFETMYLKKDQYIRTIH